MYEATHACQIIQPDVVVVHTKCSTSFFYSIVASGMFIFLVWTQGSESNVIPAIRYLSIQIVTPALYKLIHFCYDDLLFYYFITFFFFFWQCVVGLSNSSSYCVRASTCMYVIAHVVILSFLFITGNSGQMVQLWPFSNLSVFTWGKSCKAITIQVI